MKSYNKVELRGVELQGATLALTDAFSKRFGGRVYATIDNDTGEVSVNGEKFTPTDGEVKDLLRDLILPSDDLFKEWNRHRAEIMESPHNGEENNNNEEAKE